MKFVKNRVLAFILVVVFILGSSGLLVYKILFEEDDTPAVVVKVSNNINNWNYSLDDRDTNLMKTEFETLKENLEGSNIDYEKYAASLAKLYIIDLYTINNKTNIYDIPCLEYVYPTTVDNFKTNIKNTLYMYLIDNSDGKRKQELPEVSSITVGDATKGSYTINNKTYDAYIVNTSWTYKKDLGYDENATLTIVKVDKKLYVAKQAKDSSSSN